MSLNLNHFPKLVQMFSEQIAQGTGIQIPTQRVLYKNFPDPTQATLDEGIAHAVSYDEYGALVAESLTNNADVISTLDPTKNPVLKERPGTFTYYRIDYGKLVNPRNRMEDSGVNTPPVVPNLVTAALLAAIVNNFPASGVLEVEFESGKAPQLIALPFGDIDSGFDLPNDSWEALVRLVPLWRVPFLNGVSVAGLPQSNVMINLLDVKTVHPSQGTQRTLQDEAFKKLLYRELRSTVKEPAELSRVWFQVKSDLNRGLLGQYKAEFPHLMQEAARLFLTSPVPSLNLGLLTSDELSEVLRQGLFHMVYVDSKGRERTEWITGDYGRLSEFYTPRELFMAQGVHAKMKYLEGVGLQEAISQGILTEAEYSDLKQAFDTKEFRGAPARKPDQLLVYKLFGSSPDHLYQAVNKSSILALTPVGYY